MGGFYSRGEGLREKPVAFGTAVLAAVTVRVFHSNGCFFFLIDYHDCCFFWVFLVANFDVGGVV